MLQRKTEETALALKFIISEHKEAVNVVQAHMNDITAQMKEGPTMGFAHTISANHEDPQTCHPEWLYYVDKKLSQQISNGAHIYHLVTNSVYWGKPTPEGYNIAFTVDFTNRGLKI
ncbi:hypothetical protein J6590_009588 [Homalodisca vitripennis]|nr:hypothetical protein J6590_009588 [Homalodisca vitripennis]